MKVKNQYMPTAINLYINYFVHGMGVLILAQNMNALAQHWHTDIGGVAVVISALGIGRLIVLFISGMLSDKFGRKPFVYLGMFTYMAFFIGILLSPNIWVAYVFGILAGIANSFLDCGTYPALMEAFPNAASSSNVMIKAFVSAGQFCLPLIISFFVASNLWFGWSFILCVAILLLNAVFLFKRQFPPMKIVNEKGEAEETKASNIHYIGKPKIYIEGICFCIYGYISQATFYLVSQWLTQYGTEVAHMGNTSSHALMSYYAVGSIICVFLTAVIARKISTTSLMLIYTFISMIALGIVVLYPTQLICILFSFVIGFSAAGGVMQLALVLMAEVFPRGKGTMTGVFYTLGSIASFTIPLFTGAMAVKNVASVMVFDFWIAVAGFAVSLIIAYRVRKVIKLIPTEQKTAINE